MNARLLELFLIETDLQCDFALMAWNDAEEGVKGGNNDRVWYSLQAFLIAAANVSKLLWPPASSSTAQRCRLRDALNIEESSPLRSRDLRNCFEHFEERLETWARAHSHAPFVDRNIFVGGGRGIAPQDGGLRNLEVVSWTVTFRDERYCLPPIVAAVRDLRSRARLALARLEDEVSGQSH